MELHSDSSEGMNAWESDQDDVWGDEDNVAYDRVIAEKEWSKLHENYGNAGYREGIEEGKEGTLQQGFNQGWSEGVQYGYELGRLRGLISPLVEYIQSSEQKKTDICSSRQISAQDLEQWIKEATALVKELVELDIAKVFDKAYFDDGLGPQLIKSTSTPTSDSTSGTRQKSDASSSGGCCGGKSSGSANKDGCCKSSKDMDQQESTTAQKETVTESGSGCCGGKSTGTCSSSKTTLPEHTKESTNESPKLLPSGLPALSTRPDQVMEEYRCRVKKLLKVFEMDTLVNNA
ncbi:hypothetical protein BGZ94_002146 [Podila epigama]|nr:hypothetical protein BGZ94_002146 [Podila epigama]